VADQQQYMVLNGTSGNLWTAEQTCIDVCDITKNTTTVFAIFDMCKDMLSNYPRLTKLAVKDGESIKNSRYVKGRGKGKSTELHKPFWYLAGAESLGVVAAVSVLAREVLVRMQEMGAEDGVLSFP